MKPDLGVLADIDDIFIVEKPEEDEELLKELLFSALDEALNAVIKMRKQEGSYLAEDLKQRSLRIENKVKHIAVVVVEFRLKLEQWLK